MLVTEGGGGGGLVNSPDPFIYACHSYVMLYIAIQGGGSFKNDMPEDDLSRQRMHSYTSDGKLVSTEQHKDSGIMYHHTADHNKY